MSLATRCERSLVIVWSVAAAPALKCCKVCQCVVRETMLSNPFWSSWCRRRVERVASAADLGGDIVIDMVIGRVNSCWPFVPRHVSGIAGVRETLKQISAGWREVDLLYPQYAKTELQLPLKRRRVDCLAVAVTGEISIADGWNERSRGQLVI